MRVATSSGFAAAVRRSTSASCVSLPRARKSFQVRTPGSVASPSISTTALSPAGRPPAAWSRASDSRFSTTATAASACSVM